VGIPYAGSRITGQYTCLLPHKQHPFSLYAAQEKYIKPLYCIFIDNKKYILWYNIVMVLADEGVSMALPSQTKKSVGRPKGEASMIVNIRLSLSLIDRLDRYVDYLETTTGLKPNRAMITRRALVEFLDSHEKKQEK
jgi:hypothetical protein